MNEREPLFLPASFFMMRAPFLPIDEFKNMQEAQNAKNYIASFYAKDTRFREAVALASPALKKEIDTCKNTKEIAGTLFKYFSRMSSRSTPFGLFAFVSQGSFGSHIQENFDIHKIIKRARPDMEWLQNMIEKICNDPEVILQLPIQRNPLLKMTTDRFSISYLRQKEDQAEISIQSNSLTQAIFMLTQSPIVFSVLIEKILVQLPHLDRIKIQETIQKLLKEQFLWFSLLPSLMALNPFQDLLKNIPSIYLKNLVEIGTQIENYSQSTENGEELLKQLEIEMKTHVESRCYLQVDAAISNQIVLPEAIAQEIAQSAETLWKLPFNENSSLLNSYFGQFLNKYGTSRLVPLMELLDESVGLGVPQIYQNQKTASFSSSQSATPFKNWLVEVFTTCLREKKYEIELNENLINKWSKNTELEKALPSLEVFFELIADSAENIEKGAYQIVIKNLSFQVGSTFGRFLDLLGVDFREILKNSLKQEESLDLGSLFIESSYLPPMSSHQNVCIHPQLRKEMIDLSPGGIGTILIKDLYVGALNDRLFLTSKEGTIEYYVTANNLLNPNYAPLPLRFIRDVSKAKYKMCELWNWGDLALYPFLPRVSFNKTILSPAEWNVNLERIGGVSTDSLEILTNKFEKWADDLQMVRYVFLVNGDQKLLLDRFNKLNLDVVIRLLKNGVFVKIMEKVGQEKGEWVTSQYGKHCSEFVLPLLKNPKFAYKKEPFSKRSTVAIPVSNRWRLPGSDWLFVKLYMSQQNEKRFLTHHLWPFADFFREQQIVKEWFFMRYSDERPHIRLRLHGNPEQLHQHVLTPLSAWSQSLLQKELIQDMAISSYEREIERYGGEHLIEYAESVFCADSQTALHLLSIEKKLSIPSHVMGALSILNFMKTLNLDLDAQQSFFDQYPIDKQELNGFREWKNIFLSPEDALIQGAFEKRNASLVNFALRMSDLSVINALSATPFSIVDSLIHMHCNRLFGLDLNRERKARAFACHALGISKRVLIQT